MKNAKQMKFLEMPREHGGTLAIKKRKNIRPLTAKYPVHIVLRSERAKGPLSLLNYQNRINRLLQKWALEFQISIYEKAIVGNHIHLLIRGKIRKNLQDFFRTAAALIARLVTGAKKGKPFGRFWTYLLYSRCLSSWGREFQIVRNYVIQNVMESLGLVPYKPRKTKKYLIPDPFNPRPRSNPKRSARHFH